MLKWPDQDAVLAGARAWACALQANDAAVREVWCVGSYARGDWGVGSDVDLVVVLHETPLSPAERYHRYYPAPLPVHADLWVHTVAELDQLREHSPHIWRRLMADKLLLSPPAAPL